MAGGGNGGGRGRAEIDLERNQAHAPAARAAGIVGGLDAGVVDVLVAEDIPARLPLQHRSRDDGVVAQPVRRKHGQVFRHLHAILVYPGGIAHRSPAHRHRQGGGVAVRDDAHPTRLRLRPRVRAHVGKDDGVFDPSG